MNNQIFIGIPVIHDLDIDYTLQNCLENSDNPKNIHFGIYGYVLTEEWRTKLINLTEQYNNLSLITVPLEFNNLGIGKGRKGAGSLYQGQEYLLSIDSHTKFGKGWDTFLKNSINKLDQDKPILTGMASWYEKDQWVEGREYFVLSEVTDRYVEFVPRQPYPKVLAYDDIFKYSFDNEYAHTHLWNGNFSFSKNNFFNDLSDLPMYNETWIQSIELYSKGYEFITPLIDKSIIGHLYQPVDTYYFDENFKKRKRFSLNDFLSDAEKDKYYQLEVDNLHTYCKENEDSVYMYQDYLNVEKIFKL